ncbi:glycine zipper 2TM domain-containing protein [Motiliproteus sediminis]|uniref:glycine zipper 2TM domain-containing protein n=1 Tax=Motiliproteus sediminis TaxID=1468178 RepID=UPI001AEF6278|nr:glycine zipper 2TM domain-containing protein [Motiliproteus sediminis]
MFKQLVSGMIIAGMMTGTALADHRGGKFDRGQGHTTFAKVVNVEPITKTYTQRIPQESCWQEQVRYEVPVNGGYQSATPAILGTIIGAAIGNSLGNSHHKTNRNIKTVAGGLIGASIGNDIGRRHSQQGTRVEYRNEERCEVSYDTRYEERIVGYDVTYRFQGETYHTRMDYDPGNKLKVKVNVRPVM